MSESLQGVSEFLMMLGIGAASVVLILVLILAIAGGIRSLTR